MIKEVVEYLLGLKPQIERKDGPFSTVVFGNGTRHEISPEKRARLTYDVGTLADFAALVESSPDDTVVIVGSNGVTAFVQPTEYHVDNYDQGIPFYTSALPQAHMIYDKFITWLEINEFAVVGKVGDKTVSYEELMESVKAVCYSESSKAEVKSGGVVTNVTLTTSTKGDGIKLSIPSVIEAELPYGIQEFTTHLKWKLTMDKEFGFSFVLLNQIQALEAYKVFAVAALRELLPDVPVYKN